MYLCTGIYEGLKSLLGIMIQIRLDPDLFGHIRILERARAVRGLIFQPRSQIGIRDKVTLAGSQTPVFTSMDALI
jgi:hypothetical protein